MQYSTHQQIVNFIDENHSVTFSQINKKFPSMLEQMAFDDLLKDGAIRQVIADKNLGTYKYCLAA